MNTYDLMSSPYDINTCHDRKSFLRPWLVVNNYVLVIKKAERNIYTSWFSLIAFYIVIQNDQHSWNRDCMLWHLGFFPYIPAIGLPNETCRYWINREWGWRKVTRAPNVEWRRGRWSEQQNRPKKLNSFRSYYVNNYDDLLKNKENGKSQHKGPKKFIYGQIAVISTLLALLTSNTFSHVAICSSMSWMSKNKLHTLILSLYNIANTVTESSHCHSKPDNLKPVNAIIIIIIIVIININAIMLL